MYRVSTSQSLSPAQNAHFFEILVVEIMLIQDAYNVICSTCTPSVGVPIVMSLQVLYRLGFLIEDDSIISLKNSKNSKGIRLGKKVRISQTALISN